MLANLFLHPDYFVYDGQMAEDEVARRMQLIVRDMRVVLLDYGAKNRFCVHDEFINCKIFEDTTIIEFVENVLHADEKGIFYSMLANTSKDYNVTSDELKNKCKYQLDETEVCSILILNSCNENSCDSYMQFETYEVVYNRDSWITLRRQILGNHPGPVEDFVRNAAPYFDNILFSPNCVDSLSQGDYLNVIPRKIIYNLSVLNDKFRQLQEQKKISYSVNEMLAEFAGLYKLDVPGSLQRNPSTKRDRTFLFEYKENSSSQSQCREYNCEPHLKIESPDDNYSGKQIADFHSRIYFHFGEECFANNRILVGSIGPHL